MHTTTKKYHPPALLDLGKVAEITAAIGSSSNEDQSEFPQQFPADHGSFDVCINDDPRERC